MRSADVSRSADVRSLADEETLQSLDASSSADGVLSADVRSSADVGSPTDADNLRSADALPAEDSARPALPAPTTGASSEHSTVQLSFGDGFSKQTSGELTSQVFAAERLPEPAAEGPTECDFAGERPSQSALVRITDQRFARTELPQPASSEQTHQVSPQENPLWSASKERTAQNSAEIELPWLASVERAKQDSIKDSLPRSASLERIAQASAGPEPPRSVSAERTAQVFVEDSQTLSASVERTAQDPAKPEQLPSAEDSVERLSSGEWTGTDWQIGEVLERFRIRVRAESNYPVARRHSRAAQKPLSGIISPRDQGKSARLSDPGSGEVARGDADAGSQGRLNPPTEVTENPVALPSTRATERSLSSLSSAEDQRTSARLSHPGSGDDAAVARFAAGSTNARASEVALDEMGTGQPRFNAAIAGEFGDPDLVPVVREPEAESGDGASNSGTGVGNDEVRKESGKDEIKGAERIADSVGSSYPMDRTVPVSAGGPAVPEGVLGGGERTPDWLVRNQVVDEEEGHFAPPGGTGRRPAPPSELRDGHESDPKGVKPEVAQPGGKELGSGNLLNEELLKPRSRMGGSDRALRARETETPEENEVAAGEQPVQHVAATLSLSLGAPEAHDVSAWEGKPGHNEGDGGSRKVAAGASPGAVMEEQEGENETRLAEAGKGAKVAERSFPVTTKAAELQRTEQAETERMTDVWVALSPRIWERPAALAPGAEHEVEVFNFAAWESDKDGTEQVPAEREGTLDGMERVLAEREAETKEGGKSEGAGLRGIDSGGLASNGNSVDGVVVGGSSVGGMRPSENESNGTELDGTESDGIESEGASLETTGLDRNTSEHPIVDELSLEETSLDRNTFGETCWDGTNADGTNPDGISLSGTSLDGPNSNGTRANATSPSGTGVGGTSLDGNGQEGAISDATTLDGKNLGGTGLGSGGTAVLPKLKLGPRAEQRAVPASERERRSAAEAEAPAVAMELSEFRPALKQVKTRMKSSPERVKVSFIIPIDRCAKEMDSQKWKGTLLYREPAAHLVTQSTRVHSLRSKVVFLV